MKLSNLLCVFLIVTSVVVIAEDAQHKSSNTEADSANTASSSSPQNIEVAALGRSATFGDLYDAATNNFIEIIGDEDDDEMVSIFVKKYNFGSEKVITTNITNNSKIDYVKTETLSEKLEKMNIQPHLYLDVLSRSINGLGGYLVIGKQSAKSVKMSLVYSIRTVREELSLPNLNPSEYELTDSCSNATHVVVGVEYGTDAVLCLDDPNADDSNVTEIRGKLEAALNTAAALINTTDEIDDNRFYDVEKTGRKVHVDLHNDYLSIRGFVTSGDPNDPDFLIADRIKRIRRITLERKGIREKKYILMPISKFREIFGDKKCADIKPVRELNKEMTDEFVQIFQHLEDTGLQFKDLESKIENLKEKHPHLEKEEEKLDKVSYEFRSFRSKWLGRFRNEIVQFRQSHIEDTDLRKLISSYTDSAWTPEKVKTTLEVFHREINESSNKRKSSDN